MIQLSLVSCPGRSHRSPPVGALHCNGQSARIAGALFCGPESFRSTAARVRLSTFSQALAMYAARSCRSPLARSKRRISTCPDQCAGAPKYTRRSPVSASCLLSLTSALPEVPLPPATRSLHAGIFRRAFIMPPHKPSPVRRRRAEAGKGIGAGMAGSRVMAPASAKKLCP